MMKTIQDYLEFPLLKGSLLGAGVMTAATPGLNIVISQTTGDAMPWSKPFTGSLSLAGSGAVGCATVYTTKHLLGGDKDNVSKWQKIWTASVGGMLSGFTICPLEAIAQTQLASGEAFFKTARNLAKYYGVTGFFRGGATMVLRETAWAATYAAFVPILSQSLQETGYQKIESDAAALVSSAGLFGALSAPVNRLRIKKQETLAKPEMLQKSYPDLLKDMLQECPTLSATQRTMRFFKGSIPRSLTSALAGGLFFKGSELYDEAVQISKTYGQ